MIILSLKFCVLSTTTKHIEPDENIIWQNTELVLIVFLIGEPDIFPYK